MISTITVNYRTASYVEKMLESLFTHHKKEEIEVFVVENGSGEDLAHLEEKFPQVKFIYSEKNLGFAGGNNLAIKKAKGDFVCLVNPDVIFDHDALYQLERQMKKHPEVGIGGVSLKNLDGTQQACVWRFPQPTDQILLLLKVPHAFPSIGPIRRWLMKDFDYTKSADVDQVMGAMFCIRREVFDKIGLLDDGFFMWYEEVDFCKRASMAGWKIRYFANIPVRHKKGSSFETVRTIKKQSMVRQSLRRYMKKHFGWKGWVFFTLLEPLYFSVSALASVIKPK